MEKKSVTLEELLEENIELTKENNRLIKAMRRDALIGGVLKVLIWGVLIGGSIYFSMKYLEPLLVPAQEMTQNPEMFQMLLDAYNGKFGVP